MHRRILYLLLACLVAFVLPACSRQTAEEKGKEMATEKIDLVKGVGEALKEKGSQAAESVAHGTGGVLQGVGEGFGKAFEWKLTNAPGMEQAGLTVSRVGRKPTTDGKGNGISVYVVATRDAAGTLSMVAYDSGKRETARIRTELEIKADDGRYETLVLDERTPLNTIREVTFDFRPAETESRK